MEYGVARNLLKIDFDNLFAALDIEGEIKEDESAVSQHAAGLMKQYSQLLKTVNPSD